MFIAGGGIRAPGFRSGLKRFISFVSALTLNSCLIDGHPILASISSAGHIALWNLNEGGRLLHMIRGVHDAAISWVAG